MKTFMVLMALVLSGCTLDSQWSDVPGAVVTPQADRVEDQAAWSRNVAAAVVEWNDGLLVRGCLAPFVLGEGGHAVKLYYTEEPAQGLQTGPGLGGDQTIQVWQANPTDKRLVRHELGHALGLDHTSAFDGPTIMAPGFIDSVYPADFDHAACVLGCGPC